MTKSGSGQGKVAIVTGASSGIGEATARVLADAGFAVVLAARRKDLLDALAQDIESKGNRALSVPADLSKAEDTSALVQSALDAFGRVDVLVNNAGYGPPFALEQLDREAMRHVFDVNLLSGMQLISELTPVMRAQGGGRVINIGSLTQYVAAPIAAAYAATKKGMEAMTDCMRLELSPWNIKFSVVVPGFVDTPTFDKSREARAKAGDESDNPYSDLMDNLDAFANEQLKKAVSPNEVGAVVLEAATAKAPKTRYFIPKSAKTAARVFGAMPDSVADRLLLKMYKWGPGHA